MKILTKGAQEAGLKGFEKFYVMFFSATIAIALNTLILKSDTFFKIKAGAGGLFGLLKIHFAETFSQLGLSSLWTLASLPQPGTLAFYIFFHSLVGYSTAILYVYVIEKRLLGSGLTKGAIFSLLPWVINSVIVLPLLGKGFAGSDVLDITGIIYFFIANGLYGVVLGYLYERCTIKRLNNTKK